MKTIALIEMGKDGTYGIFTPNLNSTIVGDGATIEEAKADFMASMRAVILAYAENNMELPEELKNIEFEYKYDEASFKKYGRKAKHNISTNTSKSRVYA